MREFRELVDVAFDTTDKSFELRKHFVYVGGDFRHRTRKDIEIVVAVHFQFAEIGPEGSVARGRIRECLPCCRWTPRTRLSRRADAIEFVLLLEFANFALQPFLRE